MFSMEKTLIVVYKDEMLVNQLRKMVETNDDSENEIVGTKDGSINIVAWSEKVWLAQKKAGNIKDKVLFLGNIRGTDKLLPVIDERFNDSGVLYGWAGSQAIVYADPKMLSKKVDYLDFVGKLSDLPIPEMIKTPVNAKSEGITDVLETEVAEESEESTEPQKKKISLFQKAKNVVSKGTTQMSKVGSQLVTTAEDFLRDKKAITRQMLFYGIVYLYRDALEKFMNS